MLVNGVNQQCETCLYFDDRDVCRRHAPVVYPNAYTNLQQWPRVLKTEWCGDYSYDKKEKKNET